MGGKERVRITFLVDLSVQGPVQQDHRLAAVVEDEDERLRETVHLLEVRMRADLLHDRQLRVEQPLL